MSHHYSGPDFGFPWGDARLDLTDICAFPAPNRVDRSILIMNVHPSSTVIRPGPTTVEPFAPNALYKLRIDTDGDMHADISYQIQFSRSVGGGQTAKLICVHNADMPESSEIIFTNVQFSMKADAIIAQNGEYRFSAGWRSESFFFDTLGVLNDLRFTGSDSFADKNVCSIVLEVPNSVLDMKTVNLRGRILANVDGKWVQAERGARPQQAVFLPGPDRDAYLSAEPADDERFIPIFAHALEHTGGYAPADAMRVAGTLLPDVMIFDPTRPASFPDNGRALTDDAADVFLASSRTEKSPERALGLTAI